MPTFDCEYSYTKPGNIAQATKSSDIPFETAAVTVSIDEPDDGETTDALLRKEVGSYVAEVFGKNSRDGMRIFLTVTKFSKRE